MTAYDATSVWKRLLTQVISTGTHVMARHNDTLECIRVKSLVDMRYPVVGVRERKIGYSFMAAEAHWILTGSNQLSDIRPYAEMMSEFSDGGYVLQGAYGPKITEQLRYVVDVLTKDIRSRQAVINIWRESPRESKDIPCTLSLQFLIRDQKLETIATMRSSDLWLGWPYDVFSFTMVSAWLLLNLPYRLELGMLSIDAGSQHLYTRNLPQAVVCSTSESVQGFNPLTLSDFTSPDHLRTHLRNIRDKKWSQFKSTFMEELKDE